METSSLTVTSLPIEIQTEILSYLSDIVDQACAGRTCPLWSTLICERYLQASRYHNTDKAVTIRPPATVHKIFDISAGTVRCDATNGSLVSYQLKTHRHGYLDLATLVEDPMFSPFSEDVADCEEIEFGSTDGIFDNDPTDTIWFKIRTIKDLNAQPWVGWQRKSLAKNASIKTWINAIFEKIKWNLEEQGDDPQGSFEIYLCEGSGYRGDPRDAWILDIFVFILSGGTPRYPQLRDGWECD
ncbi:hypothetical protein H072_1817 [Dactylellina haptotyla CBS 200.50]|uniref:F-box domain-containing protein n=1 Tax=Dactylellina haptotyla (strain CBS 200.50) TaxID=1284197 RepID=S8AMM7_DACHA|nr:hypothetical protein H072_1817 [Dactylellina haptotyla CBS 200.50]